MVKKKLLALGVSAVAVTAVVGAGFAGWTFTSEAKKEQGFGINVTAAYSFGTVAIDTNAPDTVVLDQSAITLAKTGALNNTIANVTATWTVNTVSYTDAVAAGLTYTVNVYVNSALSTYIELNGETGTTVSDATSDYNGYTKYTLTPTTATATTNATDATKSDIKITVTPAFVYTASKPNTFEKYQAMVAAIKGVQASTVTTDMAYDVAASGDASPVVIEFVVTKTTD